MKRLTGSVNEIAQQLRNEQQWRSEQATGVEEQVQAIIKTVRQQGDAAVIAYTKEFDGVTVENLAVSQETIEEAFERIDPDVLAALEAAKKNILSYHRHQVEDGFADFPSEGVIRGQCVLPLVRVAIYVPGGTAAYPSSVLMNALPAKLAGVREVIMLTPPPKEGVFNAAILVAAKLAGVDRVYQVGGAQSIAAAAYGTESIPRVDKIVGPGNQYVATAKKQVFGQVGIDMIAGPSEVGVIADESADPVFVAADLLSQAEHDRQARAILVTTSAQLAAEVELEIERQLAELPREDIARASIEVNGRIILAASFDEMFDLMNEVAPEHLEVDVEDAINYLGKIKHAGSVFLGRYTSEPIGDYFAGTNHVLPTSGTARFSSPLGVYDFVKRMQYISYNQAATLAAAPHIKALAYKESLHGHAKAIEKREEAYENSKD